MFDEASACDSRRVRMPTYALMHTLPLCSPLFARTCCRCRPRIDRQRWSDRLAVAELMRARHCSVESDAVGPCRHDAHGGFTLALPSPLLFLLNADLHAEGVGQRPKARYVVDDGMTGRGAHEGVQVDDMCVAKMVIRDPYFNYSPTLESYFN